MSSGLGLVILVALATIASSAPLAEVERLLEDLLILENMKDTLIDKKQVATTEDNMEELKQKILERGASSIKGIGRTFRIYDDDDNKGLSFEEFAKGLQDYGLDFSSEEAKGMFDVFDKDDSGSISFDEFLIGLRGNLNASRLAIVEQAFDKADKNGDGVLTVEDLERVYKVTEHPKFKNGEWSEEQVFDNFLAGFDPNYYIDHKVTEEDFIKYYAGISANIDNDAYFNLMVRNAWKLDG